MMRIVTNGAAIAMVGMVLLAACDRAPPAPPLPPEYLRANVDQTVEIRFVKDGMYSWKERVFSIQQLQDALALEDARLPVAEIRLLEGPAPSSVANMIDLATIAEPLGARAMYVENGVMNAVEFRRQ